MVRLRISSIETSTEMKHSKRNFTKYFKPRKELIQYSGFLPTIDHHKTKIVVMSDKVIHIATNASF